LLLDCESEAPIKNPPRNTGANEVSEDMPQAIPLTMRLRSNCASG